LKKNKDVFFLYKMIKTDTSEFQVKCLELEMIDMIAECAKEVDDTLDYHPPILMFGKVCHQQRSIGFYSDISSGYNYSKQKASSKKMTPLLIQLLDYVNDVYQSEFNGVLVNKYKSGNEYIGKHSDDERMLDANAGVVMISTGTVRTFRIRNKITGKKIDIPMETDKMYQMLGNFQKEFTHEIPVQKKVLGTRYSFTFRKHLD
jgi:alkylated DNA repair dioxygenase AlkB